MLNKSGTAKWTASTPAMRCQEISGLRDAEHMIVCHLLEGLHGYRKYCRLGKVSLGFVQGTRGPGVRCDGAVKRKGAHFLLMRTTKCRCYGFGSTGKVKRKRVLGAGNTERSISSKTSNTRSKKAAGEAHCRQGMN